MVRKVYHEQSFLEERPPDGGLGVFRLFGSEVLLDKMS
ncbi:Uncharacterised protein [Grimontia hollisae]|nr:Uncharacterised protein [Grimontia hollisae]STQ75058.1 Uncharacterised protein [Grimontia hollisae]